MGGYSFGGAASSPHDKHSAPWSGGRTLEIANRASTTADDDEDGEHNYAHRCDNDGPVKAFGKKVRLKIPGIGESEEFSTVDITVDSGHEAEIASLVLCKAASLSPR